MSGGPWRAPASGTLDPLERRSRHHSHRIPRRTERPRWKPGRDLVGRVLQEIRWSEPRFSPWGRNRERRAQLFLQDHRSRDRRSPGARL